MSDIIRSDHIILGVITSPATRHREHAQQQRVAKRVRWQELATQDYKSGNCRRRPGSLPRRGSACARACGGPQRGAGASLLHYPQTVQRKDLRHRRPDDAVNPIEEWQSSHIARPIAVLSGTGTTRVPSSSWTRWRQPAPSAVGQPPASPLGGLQRNPPVPVAPCTEL